LETPGKGLTKTGVKENKERFMRTSFILKFFISCLLLMMSVSAFAAEFVKGIYISQTTLENTKYLTYLMERAKSVGINTFVIDLDVMRNAYQKNINLVKANNLRYVARIVVFPDGATHDQVVSMPYREKKLQLVQQAIEAGADEIQLDYIRYKASQAPSSENAHNIHEVIRWFKNKMAGSRIPLQIDVFGIATFGESKYIGQNLQLFAKTVDALCPMVYPSHYEPFREHAVAPYDTVLSSLEALHDQLEGGRSVKVIPFIEVSNYRYPLSPEQKQRYIAAQIKAAYDGNADGWYFWSAGNKYDPLFAVLEKGIATHYEEYAAN
jgi:hypothetical protein